MISKEELKDIARIKRFKPYQQEKHYIQTIILNSIYSIVSKEMVFKGGTALMNFYNLPRFSEDLDFTLVKEIDLERLTNAIKRDLENLGIECSIDNVEDKDVSFTFRISAKGPLYTKEIETCYVKIEISKREEVYNIDVKELKSVYKEILSFNVAIMSNVELLSEKIRALIMRNQARDLYDLYFLLNEKIKIDYDLINKKLAYYKKKFSKEELIRKINEKKDIWKTELKPIIIGDLMDFTIAKKVVLNAFSGDIISQVQAS